MSKVSRCALALLGPLTLIAGLALINNPVHVRPRILNKDQTQGRTYDCNVSYLNLSAVGQHRITFFDLASIQRIPVSADVPHRETVGPIRRPVGVGGP